MVDIYPLPPRCGAMEKTPPRPVGRPPGRKKCEHIHVRATPQAVAHLAGLSVLLKKSKGDVIELSLGYFYAKISEKITNQKETPRS